MYERVTLCHIDSVSKLDLAGRCTYSELEMDMNTDVESPSAPAQRLMLLHESSIIWLALITSSLARPSKTPEQPLFLEPSIFALV